MARALESRVDDVLAEVDLPCLRGQDEVCARIIDGICAVVRQLSGTTKRRGKTEAVLLDAAKDRMTKLGGTFLSTDLSPSAEGNLLSAVSNAIQRRMGDLLRRSQGNEPPEQFQRRVPTNVRIEQILIGGRKTPQSRAVPIRQPEDNE